MDLDHQSRADSTKDATPVKCMLINTESKFIVRPETDVTEDFERSLAAFNHQLGKGASFIDVHGKSFKMTESVSFETLKKLEFALSSQSQQLVELGLK